MNDIVIYCFVSGPALILWGLFSSVSYSGRYSAPWEQRHTWLSNFSQQLRRSSWEWYLG